MCKIVRQRANQMTLPQTKIVNATNNTTIQTNSLTIIKDIATTEARHESEASRLSPLPHHLHPHPPWIIDDVRAVIPSDIPYIYTFCCGAISNASSSSPQ